MLIVLNIATAHGLIASFAVPLLEHGPLRADDVARVTDELVAERPADLRGIRNAVSFCWITVSASASAPARESS